MTSGVPVWPSGCWSVWPGGTEAPARGLGRLRAGRAAPVLREAWAATRHSYARADILTGLRGAAPQDADRYLDEALDDCEPRVRRLACTAAAPAMLARVRARRDDPLENDEVRAAADRLHTRRD